MEGAFTTAETPMTTLIATLGATWQVIPEIVGLVAPETCPLYEHHPNQEVLSNLRLQCGLAVPLTSLKLWVVTSSSEHILKGIESIRAWNQQLLKPINITFFIAKDTDEVTSERELLALKELIYRVMLLATQKDKVICSLAGGRKTMSADLQHAATVFGCDALLHVVPPEPLPVELKKTEAAFWAKPLDESLAKLLLPAFIGRYSPREMLSLNAEIIPSNFPLETEILLGDTVYFSPDHLSLVRKLLERESDAEQLLNNYFSEITLNEPHENWRNLYRLPKKIIDYLRVTKVLPTDLSFIQQLPKAELHCHLGGIPSLHQQIVIGKTIWKSFSLEKQQQLLCNLKPLIEMAEWSWSWPSEWFNKIEFSPVERAERSATLLANIDFQKLHHNLYEVTEPRFQLKASEKGFSAYERPGELMGSNLLGHPLALKPYIEAVNDYTTKENIVYCELRGSPHKYYPENPIVWLEQFKEELDQSKPSCQYRFIWIIDRREPKEQLKKVIAWAVATKKNSKLKDFLVGLDLAGDEKQLKPEEVARDFTPAFEVCLPITIHAGEGESAENIWQAAYHLHADRIGHGLSLVENAELLTRFRDRRICLELCPTSNCEVIGFGKWQDINGQWHERKYPIGEFWREGLSVTINTDNPAISRTTLSQEFMKAAELWGDMFLWDALSMIKQSFVNAMLPAKDREQLLKKVDKNIYYLVCKALGERV